MGQDGTDIREKMSRETRQWTYVSKVITALASVVQWLEHWLKY